MAVDGRPAMYVLLIAVPLAGVVVWFATAAARDRLETRAAVQVWRRSVHRDDATYIYHWTTPSWIFYTTDWNTPDRRRLDWFLKSTESPSARNIPRRGHPVVREGDSLVWRGSRGVEVVGVPTGIEILAAPTVAVLPDPGWAENESRRLLAEAPHCIWINRSPCR